MSKKKDEPEVEAEEVEEQPKEVCQDCNHYQKPDGQHTQTTWCDNLKSPNNQEYVYKGDTCKAFKGSKNGKDESDG